MHDLILREKFLRIWDRFICAGVCKSGDGGDRLERGETQN